MRPEVPIHVQQGSQVQAGEEEGKPAKPRGQDGAHRRQGGRRASNPLLAKWTTPFEMPPFDRVKAKHFMPAFERAFADNIAEIDAIAGEQRQADVRQHRSRRWSGPGAASIAWRACSTISSAPTPTTSCWRSSAKSPRAWPSTACASTRTPSCSAASMRCSRSKDAPWADAGAEARAGALPPRLRARRRGARRQGPQAHGGDRAAARDARHQVQPERAGRRAGLPAGAGDGGRACRPARGAARRGRADRDRARAQGQARDQPVALERRAVPAVLGTARPARAGVRGLAPARRQRRQDRQPQDHRRDPRAARGALRACWASRRRPTQRWSSRWPRRRPTCAGC